MYCMCVLRLSPGVAYVRHSHMALHHLCDFAVFQERRYDELVDLLTWHLSLCLPMSSGGSRGHLTSVRVGARGPEGPPSSAVLPAKECQLELQFLLWPEGGEQVPGSAASSHCCSQHGPHRGELHTHANTFLWCFAESLNDIAACNIFYFGVCMCVCRWYHTSWIFQGKVRKMRRDLRSTHLTAYGARQVLQKLSRTTVHVASVLLYYSC